jgi:hypothetical protein
LDENLFDGFWPDFGATAVLEEFAVLSLGSDAGGVLFPERCHGVRRDLRRYISIIGQRFESRSEMVPDSATLSHCTGDGLSNFPIRNNALAGSSAPPSRSRPDREGRTPVLFPPSSMASLTQKWLRDCAQPYPSPHRVYADIDAALARFTTLRPKSDVYSAPPAQFLLLV